ncbi:glutathione peroxidase [Rhodosalinus sp.]|uniref:glutathione peroxidase n=1 Tax=Rhodosalinus sp. TaxID=2047741 RepID=UPI0035643E1B
MRLILAAALSLWAGLAAAADWTFDSIDGGEIRLSDYAGQPVLVVNTASLCAFTPQYEGLQALYDRYRDRGLVVLAVPSQDFRQELESEGEVKDFCDLNYGLDMPMTTITSVRGAAAHPFFAWLRDEADFVPGWNFNKVLLDGDGRVAGTWGSSARPLSPAITRQIEGVLAQG